MASKIAKSGLHYDNLKTAFERNGFDGLASVLDETVNGAVRVTKQGKIIQNIFEYFSQLWIGQSRFKEKLLSTIK